jgi:cytochrome oxidase Cu insertion factor (SCO1/SenC/PrrC family)
MVTATGTIGVMRHRFALLALLAALLLLAAGCGGDPQPDQGAAAPTTTAGVGPDPTTASPTTRRPTAPKGVIPAGERELAPDIRVTDFDGRTITLGGFRGQPVVVNFFDSW